MPLPADARAVAFILTSDLARSRSYFVGILGLAVLGDDDFGVTFDLGGGATMRLTEIAGHVASVHPVLGWNVADIASAASRLRENGVSFMIYDGFGQDAGGIWTSPDGKTRVAWFADPDGNVLSLSQIG